MSTTDIGTTDIGTTAPQGSAAAALVTADQLRMGESRSLRFEGRDHGSGISFFLVDNDPGMGPGLHRHPYTETWTVLAGQATITIGDQQLVATAGDTAVVQPGVWHGFTNTGTGPLRIMCVHASATMVQEWLEA
ncbi:cupin domain-containing protein [Auraticoccus sp. F435]|uniref:Cupin domain-containing protein n=1 Tax=Auraticoccus cholistanensis TaxID=2656650 RepID=A0A6A9UUJ8_9ACTN|nr:cupin domain-containing protein [Auraticoccus cholistanensis]MVA75415.1 cupin domain-containing protein [Auraticoccus cholistanensis]